MPTAHDLAMLDGDELAARLGDSRRELFNLRFQLATGQLDNPARVGQVRREVARANLAAEDAEREEKEKAKAAEAEPLDLHDHDHDHDDEEDEA